MDSKRTVLLLLRVAVLGFVGFAIVMYALQRSMMYFPAKADAARLESEAGSMGLVPWEHDGKRIGWKTRRGTDDRPFLVFHGNAGYAAHRTYLADLLQSVSAEPTPRVYILEYPGYGARDGSPSEPAFAAAAVEAIDALTATGDGSVVLVGESIGTGVASRAAAERPDAVGGLLLLTPFDSIVSVARHHYPLLPVGLLLRDRYESVRHLENFQGPVVSIIAENDRVIPAQFGRELHRTLTGPKLLIETPGAGHNELTEFLPPAEWRKAVEFVRPSKPL